VTNNAQDKIWNNVVRISVCSEGYEWRPHPYSPDQPVHEWRLYPRYTERVCENGKSTEKPTKATARLMTGRKVGRNLVGAIRDLADRFNLLLLDPAAPDYGETSASFRSNLFSPREVDAMHAMDKDARSRWIRELVLEFSSDFGPLRNEPETIHDWIDSARKFQSCDRLARAIKRERWGEVEGYMHTDTTTWFYRDVGINQTICSKGDFAEHENGQRSDWWAIAGRPSERAKMAFANIMSRNLRSAFSVKIHPLTPGEGTLMPENPLAIAYFMVWRSISTRDYDRYCQNADCEALLPTGTPGQTKYCNQACKQAGYRQREHSRRQPK
jgi:hypothetical protein